MTLLGSIGCDTAPGAAGTAVGSTSDGCIDQSRDVFADVHPSSADVNADGFGDLLVGSVGLDDASYLLLGAACPGDVDLGPGVVRYDGVYAGTVSVSDGGDVNGDGFGDVIIGAPFNQDDGYWEEGAVFLVLGSAFPLRTVPAGACRPPAT